MSIVEGIISFSIYSKSSFLFVCGNSIETWIWTGRVRIKHFLYSLDLKSRHWSGVACLKCLNSTSVFTVCFVLWTQICSIRIYLDESHQFNILIEILRISLNETETKSNPNPIKNPRETSLFLWELLKYKCLLRPSVLPVCSRRSSTRFFSMPLTETWMSSFHSLSDSDSIRFPFRLGVRSLIKAKHWCVKQRQELVENTTYTVSKS